MKQYVVDAFTDKVFAGNPAAVCVVDAWPPEELMMNIARENNLSETAFTVRTGDGTYALRWFTPGGEVDLCGHATLGTAYVVMNFYEPALGEVRFETMSGPLTVVRKGDLYEMDFPAYHLAEVPVTPAMTDACGREPLAAYIARDLLCVFDDADYIRTMTPDLEKIKALDGLLLHVTAAGNTGTRTDSGASPAKSAFADISAGTAAADGSAGTACCGDVGATAGSGAGAACCGDVGAAAGSGAGTACCGDVGAAAGSGAGAACCGEPVYDCISRSFAPKVSIPEDPVCGSGHCHIIPYWAAATGKTELVAYQASRRGGVLYCRLEGDRIKMSGQVAVYSAADLFI